MLYCKCFGLAISEDVYYLQLPLVSRILDIHVTVWISCCLHVLLCFYLWFFLASDCLAPIALKVMNSPTCSHNTESPSRFPHLSHTLPWFQNLPLSTCQLSLKSLKK